MNFQGTNAEKIFHGQAKSLAGQLFYAESASFFGKLIREHLKPGSYSLVDLGGHKGEFLCELIRELPEYKFDCTIIDKVEGLDPSMNAKKIVANVINSPVSDKSVDIVILRYVLPWDSFENQKLILKEASRICRNLCIIQHQGADSSDPHPMQQAALKLFEGNPPRLKRDNGFFTESKQIERWMEELQMSYKKVQERKIETLSETFIEKFDLSEEEADTVQNVLKGCDYIMQTTWVIDFRSPEMSKIQKTANTLFDLRDHTDIKYCKEISDILTEMIGEGIRLSTPDFMAFIVSRFITTQNYLQLMSDRHKSDLQIIELGAGFTPHFLNLKSFTGKYIEVDLEENSHLKQEIIKQLTDAKNINFIAGDISRESTWKIIGEHIDIQKPVIIFCEGVIAHYFSSDQKIQIGKFAKQLISADESSFVIDDTLRNHPDLHEYDVIKNGMERVSVQSGSKVYGNKESVSFQREVDNWTNIFNNTVYTIDYVMSKLEMDFATNQFKLIVCCNDTNKVLESILKNMSKINKTMRVWK